MAIETPPQLVDVTAGTIPALRGRPCATANGPPGSGARAAHFTCNWFRYSSSAMMRVRT